jgi:hypothetical protein
VAANRRADHAALHGPSRRTEVRARRGCLAPHLSGHNGLRATGRSTRPTHLRSVGPARSRPVQHYRSVYVTAGGHPARHLHRSTHQTLHVRSALAPVQSAQPRIRPSTEVTAPASRVAERADRLVDRSAGGCLRRRSRLGLRHEPGAARRRGDPPSSRQRCWRCGA